MNVAIVTFPGSSGDDDCRYVFGDVFGASVTRVWHKDRTLPDQIDLVVLPGGAAYGDHLRPGALARVAPVIEPIVSFVRRGGLVIAIGNGFQIACEVGLLPGALIRNRGMAFVSATVTTRVETDRSRLTSRCRALDVLRLPIANAYGNYWIDPAGLTRLQSEDQILLRYCDPTGAIDPLHNPNGSAGAIAGITNPTRRVFGLMPHPERAAEVVLTAEGERRSDGVVLLEGLLR